MPQTRPNGIKVPVNSDAYNLTADLATLADTSNVPALCASQTARDALTLYNGLTVYRTDLGLTQRYNGTKWYGGTGSITYTGIYTDFGAGYAASAWTQTPTGEVTLNAVVGSSPATVTHVAGQIYTIGTVPASIAPAGKLLFPGNMDAAQWSQPSLYIDAAGNVQYSTPSAYEAGRLRSLLDPKFEAAARADLGAAQ